MDTGPLIFTLDFLTVCVQLIQKSPPKGSMHFFLCTTCKPTTGPLPLGGSEASITISDSESAQPLPEVPRF